MINKVFVRVEHRDQVKNPSLFDSGIRRTYSYEKATLMGIRKIYIGDEQIKRYLVKVKVEEELREVGREDIFLQEETDELWL